MGFQYVATVVKVVCKLWCYSIYSQPHHLWSFSYVVNIESWSPSSNKESPSSSSVYIPTISATSTDLENISKNHILSYMYVRMNVYDLCVNIYVMIMSSDSVFICVDIPYQVLIPSAVAIAIIFAFILIVISLLCMKKSGIR